MTVVFWSVISKVVGATAMTKTILVWLLAIFFLATSSVKAHPQEKVYRIGFLSTAALSSLSSRLEALRQGLRELGYFEGKNIAIEYRSAEGSVNRLPERPADLVAPNAQRRVNAGDTCTPPDA